MCHLQGMYEKYCDKGLVVLGVNTADDAAIARQMLEQDNVDFPNILDTSDDAHRAMDKYETLGGYSAVPMTYVIDREGKAVAAWYGFKKAKADEIIEKLKLDEKR